MTPLMVGVSGVRGIVGPELNPLVVSRWATAFAELLNPGPLVLGRDSRTTGEVLARAAGAVFASVGREVWDLGIVPTPTVQLAVERWGAGGGLILSASHNPARWNAMKFVDGDGSFLSPERFARLRALHEAASGSFVEAEGYGSWRDRHEEALSLHLEAVLAVVPVEEIRRRRLAVALDTGHGAGGTLLPLLAARLGVELAGHGLEPDGQFAENPEPTTQSLNRFLERVDSQAAFAAMVDPDADRFAVALPGTPVIGEEWSLPLVARLVLEKRAGRATASDRSGTVRLETGRTVAGRPETRPSETGPSETGRTDTLVTNLSTSTRIESAAARFGARVLRSPVGEAHVVAEMKRWNAILGGEGNGGIIDPDVHLGRDAAVGFARFCEAEATIPGGLRALAGEFPSRVMLKEKLSLSSRALEGAQSSLVAALGAPEDLRDGLRWSLPDGFVHVRASGTEPIVRIVLECEKEEEARSLLGRVGGILRAAAGS